VIYSSADTDVTPPMPIDRQFPDAPPPGAAQRNGSAINIVVDETGRVESATLFGKPSTLQEAMAATADLSAAKTWRFRPAIKAGRLVIYRRTVWVPHQ